MKQTGGRRLVWDLPLRVFHWLLVLSLCASFASAKAGFDWVEIHMKLGYWMMGLLLFRIMWGIVGPRHARFLNFIKGPVTIWCYTRGLLKDESPESVGHNPLGSLMVILMLALLAAQVGTGLFVTDDIMYSGPYNPAVSSATADSLTGWHHRNFNLILAAVGLHVLAVLFYLRAKKQDLITPMVSGKKAAAVVPEEEAIASSQLLKALMVVAVSGALVWLMLDQAPVPVVEDYFFY
jgi:cytochrome b